MGTKWNTSSVAGYATASVTDDGAATAANQVKYATVKTDLTQPIINSLNELFTITTKAKSGSYTTVASDHTVCIEVTGTNTITLLAAATGGAGYRVTVKNAGVGLVTVARSGSDTFDGATSMRLGPKEGREFIANAALDGYNISDSPRLLQFVSDTGAGGTTTSVSPTFANLISSVLNITPRSASSSLVIEINFIASITAVAATNTTGTFQLYETNTAGPIGLTSLITAPSGSGGVGSFAPATLRVVMASTGITARSFGFMGYTSVGTATCGGQNYVATIMEVL